MSHMDAVGLPLFGQDYTFCSHGRRLPYCEDCAAIQVKAHGYPHPPQSRQPPIPPSVPCATSEAAAGRVKAASQRDRILALLRAHPEGLTAAEVEAATGYSGTRARLLELSHGVGVQRGLGLIERTEEQRATLGHSNSYIWRAR